MKKYLSSLFAFILIFTFALLPLNSKEAEAAWVTAETIASVSDEPLWMYIPSISLISYVEGVGVNSKGDMDVPSGKTNNVGWYKYGVLPGDAGTAVFDAHNTAAFKNLKAVKPGDDIYVYTKLGKVLHFTVSKAKTSSMSVLTPLDLFEPTTNQQINLITCAGRLLGNGHATHRLIVSAQLTPGEVTTSSIAAS